MDPYTRLSMSPATLCQGTATIHPARSKCPRQPSNADLQPYKVATLQPCGSSGRAANYSEEQREADELCDLFEVLMQECSAQGRRNEELWKSQTELLLARSEARRLQNRVNVVSKKIEDHSKILCAEQSLLKARENGCKPVRVKLVKPQMKQPPDVSNDGSCLRKLGLKDVKLKKVKHKNCDGFKTVLSSIALRIFFD